MQGALMLTPTSARMGVAVGVVTRVPSPLHLIVALKEAIKGSC